MCLRDRQDRNHRDYRYGSLIKKNSDSTYTAVKTWNGLEAATGNMLIFDSTYYVTTGYTYRLTITATVYRNGTGETVSGYFEAYHKTLVGLQREGQVGIWENVR